MGKKFLKIKAVLIFVTRGYGSPTGRVILLVPKYSTMYSVTEALLTITGLLLFNIYRFYIKIFFFLTVLGLHCFAPAFSSCSQRGLLSSYAQVSHCSSFSW